jgi:hypothetical protein
VRVERSFRHSEKFADLRREGAVIEAELSGMFGKLALDHAIGSKTNEIRIAVLDLEGVENGRAFRTMAEAKRPLLSERLA